VIEKDDVRIPRALWISSNENVSRFNFQM
jgi:hypothetical protein